MARTELTLQSTLRTGLEVTFTAATVDGEAMQNERENVFLVVNNASAGAVAVTITTPGTIDGLAVADQGGSVAAGEIEIFGPFGKSLYNQDDSAGDTGLTEAVFVDTDTQTSITLAAVKMGAL